MAHTPSIKPPNVLVLTQSKGAAGQEGDSEFVSIKEELSSCLNRDRYVIYPLGVDEVLKTPWKDNCTLCVVPSRLQVTTPEIYHEILSYVHTGGILLSAKGVLSSALGFTSQGSADGDCLHVVVSETGGEDATIKFNALSVPFTNSELIQEVQMVGSDAIVSRKELAFAVTSEEPEHSSNGGQPAEDNGPKGFLLDFPCVQQVVLKGGGQALLSYVDLFSTIHEGLDAATLVQLKGDAESRGRFLRTILSQAGLECSSEEAPELSHTFLVCSEKVGWHKCVTFEPRLHYVY